MIHQSMKLLLNLLSFHHSAADISFVIYPHQNTRTSAKWGLWTNHRMDLSTCCYSCILASDTSGVDHEPDCACTWHGGSWLNFVWFGARWGSHCEGIAQDFHVSTEPRITYLLIEGFTVKHHHSKRTPCRNCTYQKLFVPVTPVFRIFLPPEKKE